MSDDAIISVEGLGKRYRLGASRSNERYTALRDVVAEAAARPFRSLRDKFKSKNGAAELNLNSATSTPASQEFWALKDVSFEVKRGEVLGIIGRNGAGKSTLLKILSRITDPTEGRIRIKGRVASLLEVGTGFHPELTGRENIFLNGAILGMHRHEIKSKFDEIVAFAEVERFLDTPVKRYSSGMYVRLAFAVAAHLEPEILIVDEVLAVGDADFQKKCLGKMRQVAEGNGRTVLFVSHNMAAVRSLCSRCLMLDKGRVQAVGNPADVVARYHAPKESLVDTLRELSPAVFLQSLETDPRTLLRSREVTFTVIFGSRSEEIISDVALLIDSVSGERVAIIDLRSKEGSYRVSAERNLLIQTTPVKLPLVEGEYSLGLWIHGTTVSKVLLNLDTITILPSASVSGVIPREPQYRGHVELDATIKAVSLPLE